MANAVFIEGVPDPLLYVGNLAPGSLYRLPNGSAIYLLLTDYNVCNQADYAANKIAAAHLGTGTVYKLDRMKLVRPLYASQVVKIKIEAPTLERINR